MNSFPYVDYTFAKFFEDYFLWKDVLEEVLYHKSCKKKKIVKKFISKLEQIISGEEDNWTFMDMLFLLDDIVDTMSLPQVLISYINDFIDSFFWKPVEPKWIEYEYFKY